MKKSIVFGLVALALIVVVSPGIVGYLAERSFDNQVEWAADENRELEVTATGFERGWFSSAGRHRIEFAPTDAGHALREALGFTGGGPAIIIETRLDHGIVPVTSMQREQGSLRPGLGRAESRIRFESSDGTVTEWPGVVHTHIGLTGSTSSHYLAGPGATDNVSWGAADLRVDSNARSRRLAVAGRLDSLEVRSGDDRLQTANLVVDADMRRTPHGFHVGDIDLSVDSVSRSQADQDVGFGPVTLHSESALNDGKVDSRFSLDMLFRDVPDVGTLGWQLRGSLAGLDAAPLGRVIDSLEQAREAGDPGRMFAMVEEELKTLVAGGFEADIEQFDVTLPQGTLAANLALDVRPTDRDGFVWTGFLLATEASANLAIPTDLFDYIVARNPDARALLAMGFLVPNGGGYELIAEYKKGLLTINGAPMPIPMPSM